MTEVLYQGSKKHLTHCIKNLQKGTETLIKDEKGTFDKEFVEQQILDFKEIYKYSEMVITFDSYSEDSDSNSDICTKCVSG